MKLRSGWNEGRTWPLTGARLKLLYFVSHICGNNQTLSTWKECIYGRKNYCLFPLDWSLSASTSRLKKNFAPINPMPKVCTLFRQWANNFWAACEWGCDCISICVWSITWKSRNYYSACCSTAQTNQTYLEEAAWSTLKSSIQIITTGIRCSFLYNWEIPSLSLSELLSMNTALSFAQHMLESSRRQIGRHLKFGRRNKECPLNSDHLSS